MTTMLQLDADVEPLVDVLRDVLPWIAEAIRHARSDEPLYFPAVEALAADMAAAFERAVLQVILAACDRTSPLKTQDGQTLRVRCRRAVTLFSRSGPITVVRSIYGPDGSSNGNTYDPVRARCGALGHWLPATSAAMAMRVEHVPQMAYCTTMSWHDSHGKTLRTVRYA